MLVISRKIGESVVVADNITLTILDVSGDKVSLGFDADRSIRIMRKELLDTVRENKSAVDSQHKAQLSGYKKRSLK